VSYTSTTRLQLFKPVVGTSEPFRASDFNDNMDKIDAEAVAVDTRLDTVEAGLDTINVGQDGRLTALEEEDVVLDGRLDTLEALNISTRLTTAESVNATQTSKLSTLEGYNLNTRVTTNESDISAIETLNTAQNNRLAVLEIAAGNPPIDFSVDGGTP